MMVPAAVDAISRPAVLELRLLACSMYSTVADLAVSEEGSDAVKEGWPNGWV